MKAQEAMNMDVLKIAREAGLAVLLEARIGQQDCSSVSGSKDALLCFVKAIRVATTKECRLRARLRLRSVRPPCRWRTKGRHTGSSPHNGLNVCYGAKKRARKLVRYPMLGA